MCEENVGEEEDKLNTKPHPAWIIAATSKNQNQPRF